MPGTIRCSKSTRAIPSGDPITRTETRNPIFAYAARAPGSDSASAGSRLGAQLTCDVIPADGRADAGERGEQHRDSLLVLAVLVAEPG
jgi:hypothetical protein